MMTHRVILFHNMYLWCTEHANGMLNPTHPHNPCLYISICQGCLSIHACTYRVATCWTTISVRATRAIRAIRATRAIRAIRATRATRATHNRAGAQPEDLPSNPVEEIRKFLRKILLLSLFTSHPTHSLKQCAHRLHRLYHIVTRQQR